MPAARWNNTAPTEREPAHMEAIKLNEVDLARIPDAVRLDLCKGAIEMAIRAREDPEYQERFEAWKRNRQKSA